MKKSTLILSLAAMSVFLGSTQAATVGVVNYNDPQVAIFGGGNPDGNYTSATSDSMRTQPSVAVRFKERSTGNFGSTSGAGIYTFALGTSVNLEFSLESGGQFLDSLQYTLSLDTDPGPGQTWITFDPLVAYADNSYGTVATGNGAGVEGTPATNYGLRTTNTIAQNSQRDIWLGINNGINGTYDVAIEARPVSGSFIGAVTARTEAQLVIGTGAVPEPSAAMLAGLATLGLMTRRKR